MKASYLRVKDWKRFQHYKDRSPLWIKLYREVIEDDDSAFARLNEMQQWQLVRIWLLASKCEAHDVDGAPLLAYDETWIRRAIKSIKRVELEAFVNAGLLEIVAAEDRDAAISPASRPAVEEAAPLAGLSYVYEGETKETFSNEKVQASRSDLWKALVAAMGCEPKTRSARGSWSKAVSELYEAGATPELLRSAAAAYKRDWPNVSLTPTALAKHWHVFLSDATPPDVDKAFDAWWSVTGSHMSGEALDYQMDEWRSRGAHVERSAA